MSDTGPILRFLTAFAYDPLDSAETRAEKFAVFIVAGACTIAGSCWAAMYYAVFGVSTTAVLPLSFTVIVGSALIVSHLTRDHRIATYAQIICILYVTALIQWSIGGILHSGFVLIWAFLGPLIALLLRSLREAAFWFVLYVVNIGITIALDDRLTASARPVSGNMMLVFFAMNIGVFSTIVFAFTRYFVSTALTEREKANRLLLNILPRKVAHELKETGGTTPHTYDAATVVFTDFHGFTGLAERMAPEVLIAELDGCFRRMDEIIVRRGLEKIKTIGDAYMCAGGLPVENRTHALDCVLAALEMQAVIETLRQEKLAAGTSFWEMRVGIHTGPLVAGVVGSSKFAYDLWGDTVNTASRMESSGRPGRVNVSETTYDLVRFLFDCEHRGKVAAKGKGEIHMYFVDRIRPRFSRNAEGLEPNERFWSVYRRVENGARLVPRRA